MDTRYCLRKKNKSKDTANIDSLIIKDFPCMTVIFYLLCDFMSDTKGGGKRDAFCYLKALRYKNTKTESSNLYT